MTPRRLDPDAVTQKLELMRDALDVLEEYGAYVRAVASFLQARPET